MIVHLLSYYKKKKKISYWPISTRRRLVYVHGIFFKTVITLISVVLYLFSLVPQLRLGQDYDCVLSDLFLYSFAIFFCQSKVGHVKMKAPTLVFAKKKPKKWETHSKLKIFIVDLYFRNVWEGYTINACLSTSCFVRKIVVSIMHVD